MGKHLRWSIVLFSLFLLVGCASPHMMVMKDGTTIETKDEPQFDNRTGFYTFKSKDGKKTQVNKDAVATIKPK